MTATKVPRHVSQTLPFAISSASTVARSSLESTTRALSVMVTGEKVIRDMFYNGNPKIGMNAGFLTFAYAL